jgi:hypothetical protein
MTFRTATGLGERLPGPAPHFIELAPGIAAARAFAAGEAATLVSLAAASLAWSSATINAGLDVDKGIRDAEVYADETPPALLPLCLERLYTVSRDRAAQHAPQGVLAEIQLVRYHPGGRYIDHRDSPAPGATPRVLSLVTYLNDGFAGGETVFPEAGLAVRPEAGITIAFSPLLLHRAEPVLTGVKYALTAWYHTLPPG